MERRSFSVRRRRSFARDIHIGVRPDFDRQPMCRRRKTLRDERQSIFILGTHNYVECGSHRGGAPGGAAAPRCRGPWRTLTCRGRRSGWSRERDVSSLAAASAGRARRASRRSRKSPTSRRATSSTRTSNPRTSSAPTSTCCPRASAAEITRSSWRSSTN